MSVAKALPVPLGMPALFSGPKAGMGPGLMCNYGVLPDRPVAAPDFTPGCRLAGH